MSIAFPALSNDSFINTLTVEKVFLLGGRRGGITLKFVKLSNVLRLHPRFTKLTKQRREILRLVELFVPEFKECLRLKFTYTGWIPVTKH